MCLRPVPVHGHAAAHGTQGTFSPYGNLAHKLLNS